MKNSNDLNELYWTLGWSFGLLFAVAVSVNVLAFLLRTKTNRNRRPNTSRHQRVPTITKKPLATPTELNFYFKLQTALNGTAIISIKPRLRDLADFDDRWWGYRASKQHVDFVVCDQSTLEVLAAIELDDSSHNSKKAKGYDQYKDELLKSAGIPVLRFRANETNSPAYIRQRIEKSIGALRR